MDIGAVAVVDAVCFVRVPIETLYSISTVSHKVLGLLCELWTWTCCSMYNKQFPTTSLTIRVALRTKYYHDHSIMSGLHKCSSTVMNGFAPMVGGASELWFRVTKAYTALALVFAIPLLVGWSVPHYVEPMHWLLVVALNCFANRSQLRCWEERRGSCRRDHGWHWRRSKHNRDAMLFTDCADATMQYSRPLYRRGVETADFVTISVNLKEKSGASLQVVALSFTVSYCLLLVISSTILGVRITNGAVALVRQRDLAVAGAIENIVLGIVAFKFS